MKTDLSNRLAGVGLVAMGAGAVGAAGFLGVGMTIRPKVQITPTCVTALPPRVRNQATRLYEVQATVRNRTGRPVTLHNIGAYNSHTPIDSLTTSLAAAPNPTVVLPGHGHGTVTAYDFVLNGAPNALALTATGGLALDKHDDGKAAALSTRLPGC